MSADASTAARFVAFSAALNALKASVVDAAAAAASDGGSGAPPPDLEPAWLPTQEAMKTVAEGSLLKLQSG
eukprot:480796-Prymnesium_polylepis.1